MKAYLSGPMTGYADHNFPAFFAAEKALVKKGWDVINPASFKTPKDSEHLTRDEQWKAFMWRDFVAIFKEKPDVVVVLDGWRDSKGASLEALVLKELGRPILRYPSLEPIKEGILDEAARITSGDRQRDYDHPKPNHERIAKLWNAYLSIRKEPTDQISAEDAAFMMILLKIARDVHTPKRDSIVDICGYARCIARIRKWED